MTLETLKNCPVCNGTEFAKHLLVKDFTVSHEQFAIQQCASCQFLFTNPRPDESAIGAYYQSQDYISHHDERKDLMSTIYGAVRNYTLSQKVRMINKIAGHKGNLLDIGCGTGAFLAAAKSDGWQVAGTEPDGDARSVAVKKTGAQLNENIGATALQAQQFDVISMWHVLEHVHQLNETITWINAHLHEHGKLIIAVPNPESADAQKYKASWAAYDVPRHLYHFTKNSMDKLMQKHGMQIDQILPMWFDSFYVSMLSTKYRSGNVKLPESFISGATSNLRARSGKDLNTSSLIYVISKI